MDEIFMVQDPKFNHKNVFVGLTKLEANRISNANEITMYQLQEIWLASLEDEFEVINQRKNRNTLKVINELVNKQEGMLENVPLIHKLDHLFNSPIMNMIDFKLHMNKKVMENAERKSQFKGLKCDTKPTSMDV